MGWCLATTPWRVINFRLAAELPRKPPGTFRCCRPHRQSPILGSFESVPEVRVLSSAGITRPHRSYDPVRLPPGPPCSPRRWRCDLRPERASPDYPDHLSNVPCPIPRWIGTGAYVGCFPIPRGLPRFPGGSASTISLSRPAQTSLALRPAGSLNRPRRPLLRGFETAGYPTAPLVSYQINRQLSGWYLPPLVIRAFGAHVESRRGAVAEAMRHRSVFVPAHRTGRADLPHPALRLASPQGTRWTANLGWCLATTPWRVINFRLAAELPRKPPGTFRCCRLIANHQSSAPSKACQKSGSFPPPALPGLIGRTTLSDSRPARRARHGVGGATSGRNGPPPITRTTFPTCRAQYPGGSERVPMSVASPFHDAAFPVSQAGRHPRFHFRGLLRLHSRYGPLDRSTAQGGLCYEASRRPVTQPPRSSATRSTDNSLDGTFLHW